MKKLDKELRNILESLELTSNQALLYVTSLHHGTLPVLELAAITGLNRQNIYKDAEILVKRGLYDITRKKGRKYIPADPRRLQTLSKEKIATAEETARSISAIIPQLEAIIPHKALHIETRYFDGLRKIQEAYENELEQAKNTEVLSFAGSLDDVFKFFPEVYWDKWNKQFVRNKSRSRMLVHYSKTAQKTALHDQTYKRETRHLPDFPLKVNIDVFNTTVLIVSFYDEIALWIESPTLAQSYQIMFEALWAQSKSFSR